MYIDRLTFYGKDAHARAHRPRPVIVGLCRG